MDITKQTIINNKSIIEYSWAGCSVVYIEGIMTRETYEEAIERINKEKNAVNNVEVAYI